MAAPILETARLRLRPATLEVLDDLHRLWTHPEVRLFFWDDEVISRGRARDAILESLGGFERHGFGLWVVEEKAGRGLAGFCGLRPLDHAPEEIEVLYGTAPSRRGRGLATEAAITMLQYGFEKAGLSQILGIADSKNTASRRVLEKTGMIFEGYIIRDDHKEARYSIHQRDLQS